MNAGVEGCPSATGKTRPEMYPSLAKLFSCSLSHNLLVTAYAPVAALPVVESAQLDGGKTRHTIRLQGYDHRI